MSDAFIGLNIGLFHVAGKVDEGGVGSVYRLVRTDELPQVRAVKFVARDHLKPEWRNEINKVIKLGNTPGVVQYLDQGFIKVNHIEHLWIAWQFIDGESLKRLIEKRRVTVPILYDVVRRVLEVLHSCEQLQIQHADLHSGNIIVEKPNPISINPDQQQIWITDFGYYTASIGKDILDDY